ncbi:BadF/BadG/BcrA/BcrD ATPase family protein [Chitinimonas sp. BJB300]|uniref:BadF/BadG/BcrA/BcrD ATPase family protein n=1 Tax=Chitinimonas sp. BJB300 TaxID=1559339 RepID=UPI000C0D8E83|nr:BadF/BadG/BcrA/BcrD ATPase family protein [Chitinimonas sp. BJB300]PHV12258.1 ATPase [Chitinimonas sp. BJB300]TSJ84769.1 ATPase [Chitinimonas sp. BJB300]
MSFDFFIGVDGGGTGTRLLLADRDGQILSHATGGPSGLGLGVSAAWRAISHCAEQAFAHLGQTFNPTHCAIGLGLAGVHNASWAQAFLAEAPSFPAIRLDNDGFTTLLGAHAGQPGVIVAVGTGSVGEAWFGGDNKRTVSGWGFPVGDEGSGAWIGLRAAQLAQKALDGRAMRGPLADAVITHFGGSVDPAFIWLSQANQTTYAQLATLVLAYGQQDAAAATILALAGEEIAAIAHALDPDETLPFALCGGLAEALRPWLPTALVNRARQPLGDSATGALYLIRKHING